MSITSIEAVELGMGPQGKVAKVVIYDSKYPPVSIDRREAINRARAITGMDERGLELAEMFLMAANRAKEIETGTGYASESFHGLRKAMKIEQTRRMAQ